MGKKDSKKQKAIRLRNRKLIKKYPWLTPRNVWSDEICWDKKYEWTLYDDIPAGWRKGFGKQLLEDLHHAFILDGIVNKVRFDQIKEKFGQLRLYVSNYGPNTRKVINDYEVISEYTCIGCGKLDTPIINDYGWDWPICRDCYAKHRKRVSNDEYYETLAEAQYKDDKYLYMPEEYRVHVYHSDKDSMEIEIHDISSTVAKIKVRNKKSNMDDFDWDTYHKYYNKIKDKEHVEADDF